MKKIKLQANHIFIEKYEIPKSVWFEVNCPKRQAKNHKVRQINTKTTYFIKND